MPPLPDERSPQPDVSATGVMAPLRIGFVTNMTDAALAATERQFLRLLRAAAGNRPLHIQRLTLQPFGDSDPISDRRYVPVAALADSTLDAVIITGTEPRAPDLRDEPYWPALAGVFDWAAANAVSTIASCLAAHAAVLHFDGLARERLGRKCAGVFAHDLVAPDPLTAGVAAPLYVPHSRWNTVSEDTLRDRGFSILTRSPEAGVDLFVRRRGNLLVCFQGHLEYETDTLWKEYRRDAARFATGEQEVDPDPPEGYDVLKPPSAGVEPSWHSPAATIYRNWLGLVAAEKARRAEAGGAPLR